MIISIPSIIFLGSYCHYYQERQVELMTGCCIGRSLQNKFAHDKSKMNWKLRLHNDQQIAIRYSLFIQQAPYQTNWQLREEEKWRSALTFGLQEIPLAFASRIWNTHFCSSLLLKTLLYSECSMKTRTRGKCWVFLRLPADKSKRYPFFCHI
jgi:hypothetical protein